MIGSEDMSQTIRSFLAFELPREIRGVIDTVYDELVNSPLDVRWVRPGNIHLTVIFLGNVNQDQVTPLGEKVHAVCMKYGPFEIRLKGLGIFGTLRNPRVLWAGVEGDVERMGFFRNALQKHMISFGAKEEKRTFRPHLTLGRFRKGARGGDLLQGILSRHKEVNSPLCRLEELTLFKSDLRPEGARYTKLQTWPLVGKK